MYVCHHNVLLLILVQCGLVFMSLMLFLLSSLLLLLLRCATLGDHYKQHVLGKNSKKKHEFLDFCSRF